MRFKTYRLIPLLFLFISISCKTSPQKTVQPLLPIPINFGESSTANDSLAIATLLFGDSLLTNYIDIAMEENLLLKVSKTGIAATQSNLRKVKGLNKPFISAAANTGVRRYGFYTEEGVGNYDANFSPNLNADQFMARDLRNFMGAFQATWELDIYGKLRDKRKQAMAKVLASREGVKWQETQITAAVAELYIDALKAKKELEILDETVALQEKTLNAAKFNKMAGRTNEASVSQLEGLLFNIKGERKTKELDLKRITNSMNQLLGRYPKELQFGELDVDDSIFNIAIPSPNALLYSRPDIRQAGLEWQAAYAGLKVAKKKQYPSVNLTGVLGLQSFNPNFIISPQSLTYQLFSDIALPVLNRSAFLSEIDFQKANEQLAYIEYQKTLLNAFYETLDAVQQLDNLKHRITLKELEIEKDRNSVNFSVELFVRGQVGFLEVFVAQRELLNSQLEMIALENMALKTKIDLYRALGGGR